MSEFRKCFNCRNHIPPETDHYHLQGEVYCENCVEVVEYQAYQYFLDGEFMGDSENTDDDVRFINDYEDDYEY